MLLKRLKTLLLNPKKIMRVFSLGALLFFIGLGMVQTAGHWMPASVKQEMLALVGVVVMAAGFAIAIGAQILLIIYRFQQANEPPKSPNEFLQKHDKKR